ncbi:MAG: preprotein translocase subunit SecE [Flavobacteriales bacterium]|nr:preprotein translocase subunit SecE [Flavobacteriales bacterium]
MAGFITFLEESYHELMDKVTWPTWKELQESTVLVFITTLLLTVAVFLMDFIFGKSGGDDSVWKGMVGFIYAFLA